MKQFITLLGCIFFFCTTNAQTVKETFVSFPESILFPIKTNARLDLIDLFQAGREAIVKNDFGDTVSISQLTDDYITILTENLNLEIILLPMINESKIISTILTLCTSVCDSQLEFYSTSWKKLDTSLFIRPVDKSWFIEENDDMPSLDVSFMEFHYDNEKQQLLQTYNTPLYLSEEDRQTITPYIKEETKKQVWNGLRFE